ncbi:MAG: histidinol dehydrogenase [Lysobacteraceae bacterium]|nr:MAG: histidinol dehydrogenase [Xanthomonadaceae bacterium]
MPVFDWASADDAARHEALRRPTQAHAVEVREAVAAILAGVRDGGDAALRDYAARFDRAAPQTFAVETAEFEAAERDLDPALKAAIREAARRIESFHRDSGPREYAVDTAPGVRCRRIVRAIARVGLYVPAGSAPLPSTMLMLGVPARLAGCEDIVVCTPPRADGGADPAVLFAARQCAATRVFKIGGAHAVAAMAFGTQTVPACDKVFGPGNAWVTEAKRQASLFEGGPAIDLPAGPSEVLVIADDGADPAFVAADLLSQAEHGPDSQVLLISDSQRLIDAVAAAVVGQLRMLPRAAIAAQALARSRLILVRDLDEAFAISNRYAPEHLILALRDADARLAQVRAAGSVFLGDYAAEALGDYNSGTNHVLPTGGAARAWSGLSVASFQTTISVQAVSREGLRAIGPEAMLMAHAEGLEAHANAIALRLGAQA